MDAGAFVQENKRWLIGCAIGGLCWLIGATVVDSLYTRTMPTGKSLGAPDEVYDQSALDAAQAENEALEAELKQLKASLTFVPAARYTTWNGPADQHLFLTGRELKERVLQAASDRDVLVDDGAIGWDVPTGVDDIRRVLIGLDLVDEVQRRLFEAHDATRSDDDTARGLVAVLALKLESLRNRRAMQSGRRRDGIDIDDLLDQQTLNLQFQADEPTLAGFLEALREPQRTVVLDSWQVQRPQRPGEVCTVKATLSAIVFKDSKN
ncbi:MAG: hypothetical protein H6835_12750 [Planctomycetes bacterium]|nr:hypothetical protein [Planctomycetota bacterium]